MLRVDGVDLLHQGQDVVGRNQFVVLVAEGSIPADLAIVVGHARGDSLRCEPDADGISVGDRGDKA